MARPEEIKIIRHLTRSELDKRIKCLEKEVRVLKTLYFIQHRYDGKSVEEAADLVKISKNNAYIWQERWNQDGADGIVPRFSGGKPSKLTDEQKEDLRGRISSGRFTTDQVHRIIVDHYHVDYSMKQVRVILKKMGLHRTKQL